MNEVKPNSSDEAQGRGRPRLPEGEAMVPVMVKMKPSQKEKLQRLGGAPWVRERIDKAKEPKE
ncbi:hypothetical protein [Variovorax sp. GB1P17]|uniref:hypothetical protein n=1 Tax=Variovorax sp. GB1P17 TaxID=3443740 RepID=UPI003F480EEF